MLQVQSGPAKFSGFADCLLQTARAEGVRALWKGLTPALVRQASRLWPNVTRTFLVNAAELGTYDEAKSRLVPLLGDGFVAHVPRLRVEKKRCRT
eukprot:Skav216610  [mRNA]  locus=scaffold2940:49068:51054:+ [translate_table: standard]